MDINTTITDKQGAALAQSLNIKSYATGKDLIDQASAAAELLTKKRSLISAIATQKDVAVLDKTIEAYNSVAPIPISLTASKT